MIFITLGSQKFQFNRLLIKIDRLVEEKKINEEIFAQIGYSDYKPRNFKYKEFLDRDEFTKIMSECDKIITHGGTGAIIGAVKKEKKVLAVPRLAKYGEHVDDHQLQIIEQFTKMNFILGVNEVDEIEDMLNLLPKSKFNNYVSNTHNIISNIEKFVQSI